MKKIKLFEAFIKEAELTSVEFIGMDDWSRDLYKGNDGITYVDVDGALHTMTNLGEPISPVKALKNLRVVDKRNVKSNATLDSLKKAIIEYEKDKIIRDRALELISEIEGKDPKGLDKWVTQGSTLLLKELLSKTSYLGNGNSPKQLRDFNAFAMMDSVAMHHREAHK